MKKQFKAINLLVFSIFILSLLLTECNKKSTQHFPDPAEGCAYFTIDYKLPQTQSAQQLAEYLASEHFEYDLDGWFFFGSLVDSAKPEDLGVFFVAVQRIDQPIVGFMTPTVPAIVAFNSKSLGKYEFRGVMSIDVEPLMDVVTSPWKVTLTSPFQEEPLIVMSLVSGSMGSEDAVYSLSANIPDFDNVRLHAEVLIRDNFGTVNQGDGTASFFAQFLTESQREQIMNSSDKKVFSYLEKTDDPMSCQGSYYYSFPLLDVEQFTIVQDDSVLSSGTNGVMWMDYVVQSYDERAVEVFSKASWNFYAIQFPEDKAAMMVIEINSETGSLPIAKLFKYDGDKTLNFAHKAAHSWGIDEISIEPVAGSNWTSEKTGQVYAMKHRIQLMSDEYPADLIIEMITENQEIVVDVDTLGIKINTIKYEGLGTVEGTLLNKPISGQAFVEMQPVGGFK